MVFCVPLKKHDAGHFFLAFEKCILSHKAIVSSKHSCMDYCMILLIMFLLPFYISQANITPTLPVQRFFPII